MRVLLVHAEDFEFKVREKALKAARPPELKEGRAKNALVAFVAVEAGDAKDSQRLSEEFANEVVRVADQVDASCVVLYPYAHLSPSLAPPEEAEALFELLRSKLAARVRTISAPFGWYKEFKLHCKGHPLAELSRSFTPQLAAEPKVLKAEREPESEWFVLDLNEELVPVEEFDFSNWRGLKKFAAYEMSRLRVVEEEPPHVELMRRLELADYEPGSDAGNLRWYPKGELIKKLLEEWATRLALDYGAMQVETPVMFDASHPSLQSYLERFPARQYIAKSGDKEFFLRFAACFGQYLIGKDVLMSYKQLPLALYELTHYSFRREKKGELTGLRRLRCFTMPDIHTFCKSLEEAKREFLKQCELCVKWTRSLELDCEAALRFVKDYWDEDFASRVLRIVGKPMLIEMWREKSFYFVVKFELNFVDALDKASALSTIQIDVENAERFGITYVDADGSKKHPLILHTSISGSIDRNLYALLEKAHMDKQRGEKPSLPLWLSPTQLRLIPVTEQNLRAAEQLLRRFEEEGVRVDIDDREESVAKRVRDAEREWVPYIVVVGDAEEQSGFERLRVRVRETGCEEVTSPSQLSELIKEGTKGYPSARLPLPRFLSRRPKFT